MTEGARSARDQAAQELAQTLDHVRRRAGQRAALIALAYGGTSACLAMAAITVLATGPLSPWLVGGTIGLGALHAGALWWTRGRMPRAGAARFCDLTLQAMTGDAAATADADVVTAGASFALDPAAHNAESADEFRSAIIVRAARAALEMPIRRAIPLWPLGMAPFLFLISAAGLGLVTRAAGPMRALGHGNSVDARTLAVVTRVRKSVDEELREILREAKDLGVAGHEMAMWAARMDRVLTEVAAGRMDPQQAQAALRNLESEAREAARQEELTARTGHALADALASSPALTRSLGATGSERETGSAGTSAAEGGDDGPRSSAEREELAEALAAAAAELAAGEHGAPVDSHGSQGTTDRDAEAKAADAAEQRRQLEKLTRDMQNAADRCREDPEACKRAMDKLREQVDRARAAGEQAGDRARGHRRMERAARDAQEKLESQRKQSAVAEGAQAAGQAKTPGAKAPSGSAGAQRGKPGARGEGSVRESFEQMAAGAGDSADENASAPGSQGSEASEGAGATGVVAGLPSSGGAPAGSGDEAAQSPTGRNGPGSITAQAGAPSGSSPREAPGDNGGTPEGGRETGGETPEGGAGAQTAGGGNGIGKSEGDDPLGRRTRSAGQKGAIATEVSLAAGAGPARADVVQASAARGFASMPYRRVYADYESAVEESLDRDQVPPARRHLVQRYFRLIRPRLQAAPRKANKHP